MVPYIIFVLILGFEPRGLFRFAVAVDKTEERPFAFRIFHRCFLSPS